ncbi:MAG: class I SAM-dependent methyltransferase [Myxococcales bacterium]|nr:class I SAM-dependent methyltransferase [Myxococcales bacterium]
MATRATTRRADRRAEERHARLLARGTDDHYEDAALYDFEYFDRSEDVEFYQELAHELAREQGRPLRILELGAGTGRITTVLLRDGHHLTALDRMAPMLARLEAKVVRPEERARLRIIEADMSAPPIDEGAFDLVIAPFNALMHLYEHATLLRCFAAARRGLVEGGTFAFDVLLPDLEWLMWDPDERHAVTAFVHPTTGEELIYSTNHTYDPGSQICHIRIFYDDAPRPGVDFDPPATPRRLVHLAHRQIFPEELRGLIAAAGLRLESLSGDFCGLPLVHGVESMVARCRR